VAPVKQSAKPAKKPVEQKAEPAKKPAPAKKPVAKKVEPAKTPESPKKVETTTKSKKPTATPKTAEKVKAEPVETKVPSTKKPTNNAEKSTKATKGGKDNATDKPVATGMRATSPLTPKYPVLRPKGDHKKSASVRHITRTPFKDADLEEFKRRLLEERDRKIKLQNSMSADALSRPDEENVEEDGTNSANRADMLNRAEETRKSLLAIDDALRAIENKTYGICAVCKCAITRERLRAAPFAIRCVKCKEEWERQVKASKRSMNL
ncbi:MAG: TraR/DksA C4-type zinc finger protein, partial [Kiritimatiellae bacterium]|nr:TraR/DksA C4-type zinc finger protein [Kiritimatiellia bacterium]